MKTIVHIIDGLTIGGAERIVVDLATEMMGEYAVHVVSLSRLSLDAQPFAEELTQVGIDVHSVPKRSKLGVGLTAQLTELLRDVQADLVHTHLWAADVWGSRAAAQAGVPTISTEHNVNRDEGALKHWIKCRARQGRVVAISEAVERDLLGCAHIDSSKMSTIYNGVDVERFAAVKRNLQKPPVVAVIGRLAVQKGHADVLPALLQLSEPHTVHFVGDGPLRGALEALSHKLGVAEQIVFEGARSDIEKVYAQASVVMIPSRWEGFGLVAVEAMLSGCAVVASNVDGLREIVDGYGTLVDMSDPDAVAKAIDDALTNGPVEGAQAYARETFSRERMVAEYAKIYTEILSE